jgi:hypothetical protein
MSKNTISWHTQDISQDIESQVIASIKEADLFAIQLDKFSDITGKSSAPSIQEICL